MGDSVKKCIFLSLFFSSLLLGMEETPWLDDVYEFNLRTVVAYNQYRSIQGATLQPAYLYRNYATKAALSLAVDPSLELEVECEMARTPRQTYGFRSSAIGGRFGLLSDIAGDFVSVVCGASLRAVTGRSVRDVSSPYPSFLNGEAFVSIGKEFTKEKDWKTRGFLMGSFGVANHGSPWNRASVSFEGRIVDFGTLGAFALGYFGYGPGKEVDLNHFQGWSKVHHSSV